MKTLVLDPPPIEMDRLVKRRRRLGLDRYDEMWEGVYHMAPTAHPYHGFLDRQLARLLGPYVDAAGLVGTGPFNLGCPDDFRVPDGGCHRGLPGTTYVTTAAVVIEIVSPGDETYDKLAFYAAHAVDEVIVVGPGHRRVHLYDLAGDHYDEAGRSRLLDVSADELEGRIRWPGSGSAPSR